ncbi:MAG: hypothetical protein HY354_03670, partial [Planctomycetes bacterium]|nr:hypothetical protein [Planctomycetota bacterium]
MQKKNTGITAVPLIIALVLMISLGAFFISLMLGKHIGAPWLAQATKALFIADAGIEYTAEYLKGYGNWTAIPDILSTTFG